MHAPHAMQLSLKITTFYTSMHLYKIFKFY
jgi:hypothetical protein